MKNPYLAILAAAILCIGILTTTAGAEQAEEPVEEMIREAEAAAGAAIIPGPAEIPFSDQAVFHLPAGFGFIPGKEARQLLEIYGNKMGDRLLGLLTPLSDNWMMTVSYIPAGYVKDDDARDWDADALLENIKKATEESNATRRKRGLPELQVLGWIEPPTYNALNNRLLWSLSSRRKGEPADTVHGINYNILALGREGYISMNMVTDLDNIERLKPVAREMLSSLDFSDGKKYADFNPKTDKVAAYGLAALVAGAAAKKLGLFAVIVAFAAKFAKIIGVAAAVLFGGLFRKFRKKE